MSDELPKPVNMRSSKAAMWREIQAMSEEIDSQQATINALRAGHNKLGADLQVWQERCAEAEWRLGLVQKLAAGVAG